MTNVVVQALSRSDVFPRKVKKFWESDSIFPYCEWRNSRVVRDAGGLVRCVSLGTSDADYPFYITSPLYIFVVVE